MPSPTVAEVYPIDFCIVSGEKLGSMGGPIEITIDGRLVKLCCDACESQLRSDTAKYLAALDVAAAGDVSISPAGGASHGDNHDHH